LARTDWILSLDADEELSSALQTSIVDWKKRTVQFDVYEVARRTWYLGAWIRHSGWYPDFKKRLYRKGIAQFAGSLHETLQFSGPCGRLAGDLLHYTIHDFVNMKLTWNGIPLSPRSKCLKREKGTGAERGGWRLLGVSSRISFCAADFWMDTAER